MSKDNKDMTIKRSKVEYNKVYQDTCYCSAIDKIQYKVCNHLRIVAKVRTDRVERESLLANLLQVGHITCDNVKNNDTMLVMNSMYSHQGRSQG